MRKRRTPPLRISIKGGGQSSTQTKEKGNIEKLGLDKKVKAGVVGNLLTKSLGKGSKLQRGNNNDDSDEDGIGQTVGTNGKKRRETAFYLEQTIQGQKV